MADRPVCKFCGEPELYTCEKPECVAKCAEDEWQKKLATRAEKFKTVEGKTAIGIPPMYYGAEFLDHSAGSMVKEWFDRRAGMITLTGPGGVGKTRMLYAVQSAAYLAGIPFLSHSVPVLLKELQALCGVSVAAELEMVKKLCGFDRFLLLDDLGAEKVTEFTVQDLYIIIAEREKWERPTLITTNITVHEISEQLSRRIASRLAGGLVLLFQGIDHRLDRKRK